MLGTYHFLSLMSLVDWTIQRQDVFAWIWNLIISREGTIITVGLLAVSVLTTVLVDRQYERTAIRWRENRARVLERRIQRQRQVADTPPQESKANAAERIALGIEPNIVCLGDLDEFVKFEDDFFQDIGQYDENSVRALGAILSNEPNPPQRIGSLTDVEAQVIYYDLDFPDRETHKVYHSYWLDERYPSVSFPRNAVRKLVFGVIDCDNHTFTIFHNNHESADKYLPASKSPYRNCRGFRIKVKLIAGEHGEWGHEFDFVLKDIRENGFEFEYLSDEIKEEQRKIFNRELEKLLREGEAFVTMPLINVGWENFYRDIHDWRARVWALLAPFGRPLSYRFTSHAELQPYPHKIADGYRSFFDELYTQIENLKEIAREHGVPVLASNVYKEIQEVTAKRREHILKDLGKFAERLSTLLEHTEIKRVSLHERDLYVWDSEIFDYLDHNLNRADTALISDEHLEAYTPPKDAHESCHSFLKRAHSRLVRLNRLIDEIKLDRRAV